MTPFLQKKLQMTHFFIILSKIILFISESRKDFKVKVLDPRHGKSFMSVPLK